MVCLTWLYECKLFESQEHQRYRAQNTFPLTILNSLEIRQKKWFVAPLTSSLIGSTVDTFLFFSISFYATGIPWVTLSLGDLAVKIFVALAMLIPFRLLLGTLKASKA